MTCARARQVLAQPLADSVERNQARAHVAACPDCARGDDTWQRDDTWQHDDTATRVLSQLDLHRSPRRTVTTALWVTGLVQLFFAVPWLFGWSPLWNPSGAAATAHLTRDGVIGLVLAAIAIGVARTPRLAYFALSVCGILSVLQIVGYVADQLEGRVHSIFEAVHLLTFAITALVAMVAFPHRRPML